MSRREHFDWVVLNQSQSPAFQRMIEAVSGDARCLVFTGSPYPSQSPTVHVEQGPAYDRRGLHRRAASWAAFTAAAAARLARVAGSPFVLTTTNPPILPHLAWLLRRTKKVRYGLLLWDLYPHVLVQAGWFGAAHPLIHGWRALNRRAFHQAEVIIALGRRMAEEVRTEASGDVDPRIEIVPNWGPTEQIRPLPKSENSFAREHQLQASFNVMYSGNLGATHGLEVLVDAAHLMREDGRIRFVIIGDGLGRNAVHQRIASRGVKNVLLLGRQPWETLPLSLATADVAVVSQAPGSERNSFPSKVYSALSAGSAILAITSESSDLADLVREHDVGRVVQAGDARAIANAIRELSSDPALIMRLCANARRVAETHYSATVVQRKLSATLQPLFARA
jgi:glycosyltransferase involved in cell wall biosynthesis